METCRLTGLQAVQLGSAMLDDCLDRPERIDSIVERLEAEGISIAALAGYRNLVAPDPGKRRANIDFIAQCLELAPRFGTSVVATETGTRHPEGDWTDSPDNWRPATWELLDEAIGELVPVAERSGRSSRSRPRSRTSSGRRVSSSACSSGSPPTTSRSSAIPTTTSRASYCRQVSV